MKQYGIKQGLKVLEKYIRLFLINVSLGSIASLEDDAPIASITWVIWVINANLGSVPFKLQDRNKNIEAI